MKKKRPNPLLPKMLRKIAPRIGAKVTIEPEWGVVGQITFKSGKKSYFRYSTLDLNPVGSSDIAKDKDYANFFMKKLGYPTVPGKAFYSPDWARAIGSHQSTKPAATYAQKLGFPVIIKPNSGSQGSGVRLVHNKKEFFSGLRDIFRKDRVALVQTPVRGKDYRIVVLDDKVISAYERVPLSVMGDDRTTILGLLKRKQASFVASSRDTVLNIRDRRIAAKLKRAGLTVKSIPAKGEQIFLLDNANLSTGGDSIDVTKVIHPEFRDIAVRLTRDMGLRICGVDLMVSGDISEKPVTYWVLEINAAPGLDHYAKSGKAQEKIVEELYLEVLRSLNK